MYQICGGPKSGKGLALLNSAVNYIPNKLIGRVLVHGDRNSDVAMSQVNPAMSSSPFVFKQTYDKSCMADETWEIFVSKLNEMKIEEAEAKNLLNSDMFAKFEGDACKTAEIGGLALQDGDFFIRWVSDEGEVLLGQINVSEDFVLFRDAWITCSAFENGITIPGVTTLLFEGVAYFPSKYTFDKSRQRDFDLPESIKEGVIAIKKEWRSSIKKLNLKGQVPFDIHKCAFSLNKDEKRQLPKELGEILNRYISLTENVVGISEFVERTMTIRHPVSGDTLPYHTLSGERKDLTKDPLSLAFTIINGSKMVDSILPLAFAPGAAVKNGLSSKALLICSCTTFDECFVTFPTESFLGDDNLAWLPFLTGEFCHNGIGSLKGPYYFTTRFTYRNIKHLMFEEYEVAEDKYSFIRVGFRQGYCYVKKNSKPVARIKVKILEDRGLLKIVDHTEVLDFQKLVSFISNKEKS